ncbi:MAG: cold shock domain-containing protein [Planctomycetes bacterium]|nr:cold shock domain-containing protein [Planctomycetota bacterium]
MPQGTIKKLVSERGFGFIAASGQELFFHHSSVQGSFDALREGQTVEFEVDSAPNSKGKGPRAVQVKPV